MTEALVITLGVLATMFGACGAGACKYYTERDNAQDQIEVSDIPPARPNTPVVNLEELIAHQMEQRNSESDTEIDIKITIHTDNHERK